MFYFSICNLWMKDTSKKLTRKLISERKTNLAYLEDDLINIFRSRPKYFISGSNMIRKMFEKIKRGTSRRFWEKCKHFNWLSASATANCFACFDWISQILLFSSRGPAVENPGATWTDSAQIQILFCFYSSLLVQGLTDPHTQSVPIIYNFQITLKQIFYKSAQFASSGWRMFPKIVDFSCLCTFYELSPPLLLPQALFYIYHSWGLLRILHKNQNNIWAKKTKQHHNGSANRFSNTQGT